MKSFADYLKSFFESERKSLSDNYPGINLRRLEREVSISHLNDLYCSYQSHPFNQFISKLKKGIPLEYISHQAYFYKSNFYVNEDVLIPRSETEILVELALKEIQINFKNKNCRILDVCTGSGAIGLSLLRDSGSELEVVFSDLSEKALNIARKNYFLMQYLFSSNHKIEFIESDRLKNISGEFDLIVTNPPYIMKEKDRSTVHSQVLLHEPEMALFLQDDEYEKWFIDFFTEINAHLKPEGIALVEGHENHLEKLQKIAINLKFKTIEIIKDYTLRDRFIRLQK